MSARFPPMQWALVLFLFLGGTESSRPSPRRRSRGQAERADQNTSSFGRTAAEWLELEAQRTEPRQAGRDPVRIRHPNTHTLQRREQVPTSRQNLALELWGLPKAGPCWTAAISHPVWD